jgi:hypothetical protein
MSEATEAVENNTDELAAAIARGDSVDSNPTTTTPTPEDEAAVNEFAKGDQTRDNTGKFTKKDDAQQAIPKARFDEAIARERNQRLAAEIKAAELQATIDKAGKAVDAEKVEAEIQALEQQHMEMLLAGKGDEALKIMREIRMQERKMLAIEASRMNDDNNTKNAQERAAAEERSRVDSTIATLQADHPELDENHADFSQKLVNIILAEQVRLIEQENMAPSTALSKAAADVMELRGVKTQTLGDAKAGDGSPATKVAADRKAAATAKALAASQAQGKNLKDMGEDSNKHGSEKTGTEDVEQMTLEELSALPEATKARMRGDFM